MAEPNREHYVDVVKIEFWSAARYYGRVPQRCTFTSVILMRRPISNSLASAVSMLDPTHDSRDDCPNVMMAASVSHQLMSSASIM